MATSQRQVARLVSLADIIPDDVVCDLGFGDAALLCGLVKAAGRHTLIRLAIHSKLIAWHSTTCRARCLFRNVKQFCAQCALTGSLTHHSVPSLSRSCELRCHHNNHWLTHSLTHSVQSISNSCVPQGHHTPPCIVPQQSLAHSLTLLNLIHSRRMSWNRV